jgi:hypothetical protein
MNSLNIKQNSEISIGGPDVFSVKASTIVKLNEYFSVTTLDGVIDLKVDITADFNEIPEKYHEIFLNVLTSKYLNKVNFGQNPFSECKPIVKRKWWQFWKNKYFMS